MHTASPAVSRPSVTTFSLRQRSPFTRAWLHRTCFLLLALSCVCFVLCGCKGGGGGSGAVGGSNAPSSLLPAGSHLIPENVESVKMLITSSSSAEANYEISIHCLRETLTGESAADPLVGGYPESYLRIDYADPYQQEETIQLHGSWEQQARNGRNLIRNLVIDQSASDKHDFITDLTIAIQIREDASSDTNGSLILHGRATSGTLHLKNNAHHNLQGATVTLTYTISSGSCNDYPHDVIPQCE